MQPATLGKLVFILVFGTISLSAVPGAQACTQSPRGFISSRQIFPADGATAVPTNVQIVVSYLGTEPTIVDHLALTAPDGVSVPVTVSQPVSESSGHPAHQTFVMTPVRALQPNTKYTITSDYGRVQCIRNEYWQLVMLGFAPCTPVPDAGVDSGTADGGASAGSVAVSGFATGAGPDTLPPALSGDITTSISSDTCSSGACCGPYDGFTVSMNWANASDADGRVFYELSRDGVAVLYPVYEAPSPPASGRLLGTFLCWGTKSNNMAPGPGISELGSTQFRGRSGTYQIVAIDLAGNRSTPLSVIVSVPCGGVDGGATAVDGSTTPSDGSTASVDIRTIGDVLGPTWDLPYATTIDVPAGQPDLAGVVDVSTTVPDAGLEGFDGSTTERDSSGCSCRVANGHRGPTGFAIATLGLMLTLRRRRRTPATRE